jgi:predicted phage terminase large subunit-like protein
MTNTLLEAILRKDFSSFIHKTFDTINPGVPYAPNWHIDLIAQRLEAVRLGKIKRLIINMPPRALKSVCVSVAWPAWLLGHDPTKRIMFASYSQILSIKHSMDCRFVLSSNWYQKLFPNTILSKSHNQKSKFMTTKHGFRFSTSVGGSATGEGGDILIIDDPHNPSHIHSPNQRKKVIEWYEQTFATRLNSRLDGAIVLVMQRLHSQDLAGHLIASNPEGWEVLKIPAIAQEDMDIEIGAKSYHVNRGDLLHQARDAARALEKLESEIGRNNFAAQYLQMPVSKGFSLLTPDDLVYSYMQVERFEYFMQSWDTAIKTSETSDYSVCTIWGVIQSCYYLIDMVRSRMAYPELKNTAQKLNNKYKPRAILIEDKASGQSLIQDLRSQGLCNIVAQKPKLDKITRFAAVVPLFQASRVIIPTSAPWLSLFINELTSFPACDHDDIVDSVSQFLGYMKGKNAEGLRIRGI